MDGRLHGSQNLYICGDEGKVPSFSGIEPRSSSPYLVTKLTELPRPRRHYERTYAT